MLLQVFSYLDMSHNIVLQQQVGHFNRGRNGPTVGSKPDEEGIPDGWWAKAVDQDAARSYIEDYKRGTNRVTLLDHHSPYTQQRFFFANNPTNFSEKFVAPSPPV
jgi:hypothetical protein